MKITLCGSIAFIKEMNEVKTKLESMGHEVKMPPSELLDGDGNPLSSEKFYEIRHQASEESASWIWDLKETSIKRHFNKVAWSDAILVTNYDKRGVKGYIGGNTLMEMGLALHLGKKIYLLKEVPELSYKEEILGMKPNIINDLSELQN